MQKTLSFPVRELLQIFLKSEISSLSLPTSTESDNKAEVLLWHLFNFADDKFGDTEQMTSSEQLGSLVR